MKFNRVAVIGGGLSGLSSTYFAQKVPIAKEIFLIEASSRFGGWINTKKDPAGKIYEIGPKTIRCSGDYFTNTLELINDLGLVNDIISFSPGKYPYLKKRYICKNEELYSLPSSFGDLFEIKKPFTKPLIVDIIKELFKSPSERLPKYMDTSIQEFALERFGKEIADNLIGSLISGICAGDPKKISARFLFSDYMIRGNVTRTFILNKLKKTFSKTKTIENDLIKKAIRERWSSISFKNGLSTLTDRLYHEIQVSKYVTTMKKMSCTDIRLFNGFAHIELDNGRKIIADRLICALPANKLRLLIMKQFPELADLLNTITYSSIIICTYVYKTEMAPIPEGFGYLVPPIEQSPVLGVIFDSNFNIYRSIYETRLTVMLGGPNFNKIANVNCYNFVSDHLRKTLHINRNPDFFDISVLKDCIPQHNVNHYYNLMLIRNFIHEKKLPITLCGASYDGISINDVIQSGKQGVENLI